ncbi:MAG TPA: hypothetical protein VOB72_03465 [Candidatus Dormibacteraeota bacterium]|nr:hypothetical protein [Candidatus Dormibacteraeota bacterium]
MTINRTQALVLGFGVAAWLALIVLLLTAPDVIAGGLKPPSADSRAFGLAFLAPVTALIGLLGVGVVRRWRWMFWLLLVAFLAGVLRVPAAALELAGILLPSGPTWYVLLQAAIGLVQFAIAVAMLFDFRRAGVWGAAP